MAGARDGRRQRRVVQGRTFAGQQYYGSEGGNGGYDGTMVVGGNLISDQCSEDDQDKQSKEAVRTELNPDLSGDKEHGICATDHPRNSMENEDEDATV
uniref:Uncharacterized protein n=1 Tax=Leersia perrieri TaxID=77586 RepID=A0A0D9WY66_9ORYZ